MSLFYWTVNRPGGMCCVYLSKHALQTSWEKKSQAKALRAPSTRPAETWATRGALSPTAVNEDSAWLGSVLIFTFSVFSSGSEDELCLFAKQCGVNFSLQLVTNNFTLFQPSVLSSSKDMRFLLFYSRNTAVNILSLIIVTVLPGQKVSDRYKLPNCQFQAFRSPPCSRCS